ncbi:MAG: hypothetical protein ACMUHM_07675 [Thermoplasmatota archaeon]
MGKRPGKLEPPVDHGPAPFRTAFSPTGNLKGDWTIIVMSPEDFKKDFKKRISLGIFLGSLLFGSSALVIFMGIYVAEGAYGIMMVVVGILCGLLFLGLLVFILYMIYSPNTKRESRVQVRRTTKEKVLRAVEEFVESLHVPYEVKRYKDGIPCTFVLDNGIKIRTVFIWSALQPNGHVAILYKQKDWEGALELQLMLDEYLVGKKVVVMKR